MADKLMRTLVVISFFLILALFSSCGANQRNSGTDADNNQQITTDSGNMTTVALASNPAAGYTWQVMKIDNEPLFQEDKPEHRRGPEYDLAAAIQLPIAK